MKHQLRTFLAVSTLVVCGPGAFGQYQFANRKPPEPTPLHQLGWSRIAKNPNIQKELALSQAEKDKLREDSIRVDHEANLVDSRAAGQLARETVKIMSDSSLSAAQREAKLRETREMAGIQSQNRRQQIEHGLNARHAALLKNGLPPAKFQRLHQIYLQSRGAFALQDPSCAEILGLSQSQSKAIEPILATFNRKQIDLTTEYNQLGRLRGGIVHQNALNSLVQERDAQALETLTKAQQKKFSDLKGKPYDLNLLL